MTCKFVTSFIQGETENTTWCVSFKEDRKQASEDDVYVKVFLCGFFCLFVLVLFFSWLVSWCFKPSQPQGITSGLFFSWENKVHKQNWEVTCKLKGFFKGTDRIRIENEVSVCYRYLFKGRQKIRFKECPVSHVVRKTKNPLQKWLVSCKVLVKGRHRILFKKEEQGTRTYAREDKKNALKVTSKL